MAGKRFSERFGFRPAKSAIQLRSVDADLRNSLWNILLVLIWQKFNVYYTEGAPRSWLERLYFGHLKKPIDQIEQCYDDEISNIRDYFYKLPWYEVYDFIEFIAKNPPFEDNLWPAQFMAACNVVFERELSAYRFIGGVIAPLTAVEEIAEIDEALKTPLAGVRKHIKRALELFSDRKSPDYRNSVKESISSVESICRIISGKENAILSDALKVIKNKLKIHPALEQGFQKIYGYTSDEKGIRHALLEESNAESEDARFMLVSCSAFINYLIAKSAKAGLKIT